MRGRPRKPTALKKAQGTLQKCRENKREPQLKKIQLPPPPKHFDAYALELYNSYKELVEAGAITNPDMAGARLTCEIFSEYKNTREIKLLPSLIKLMTENGLTPASRSRLNVPEPKEKDAETEKMKELIGA